MLTSIQNLGQRETSFGAVKKFHLVQFCIELARYTLDGDKQASRMCIGERNQIWLHQTCRMGAVLIQGICKLFLINESIEKSLDFSVSETTSMAWEVIAETSE